MIFFVLKTFYETFLQNLYLHFVYIACNLKNIYISRFYYFKLFKGWSAAVANMLDTVEKFKFKADIFQDDFKRYLNGREDSIHLLNKYVINYYIKINLYNYT